MTGDCSSFLASWARRIQLTISNTELVDTAAAIRAGTCRSSISAKQEYRSFAQCMPLVDVN
jgi:hypothetical protein